MFSLFAKSGGSIQSRKYSRLVFSGPDREADWGAADQ